MNDKNKISLLHLFLVMAKIGAFTIGGGYAMIIIIEREITSRGWISKEEFPDLIALSQAAPGLLAVNISIFTGYRLRGVWGAIVATLGSCTPSFLIILAIAMFFSRFRENTVIERIFKGMRPAVVALIAVPMIQMALKGCRKWWQWALMGGVLCAASFLHFSPVYILLVVLVASLGAALYKERRRKR